MGAVCLIVRACVSSSLLRQMCLRDTEMTSVIHLQQDLQVEKIDEKSAQNEGRMRREREKQKEQMGQNQSKAEDETR